MIKDLTNFVADLSDLQMPEIDAVIVNIVNTIRNAVSRLQSVTSTYCDSYNSNRIYHYDNNMNFVDDTTDEMAAPATAVLENAVGYLKGVLDSLQNTETGSKLHDITPNSGHMPSPTTNSLIVFDSSGFTFSHGSMDPSGLSTKKLGDYIIGSGEAFPLLTNTNGYRLLPGVSLTLDGSGYVHLNFHYFDISDGKMHSCYDAYVTSTPFTADSNLLQVFAAIQATTTKSAGDFSVDTTHCFGTVDPLGSFIYLTQNGTESPDAARRWALLLYSKYEAQVDWSLYDQTTSDIDAVQAILGLYPDIAPLINDLEAVL